MMNTRTPTSSHTAWTITAMLTAFTMINFLDKIALGMVAVPLMEELHLTPSEFGLIAGSFYWLFSISAVVVGFVSNRVQGRLLLIAMGLCWAVLQLPIALAGGATTVLVCRVLLGAAEGPATPVAMHALYKWFPDERRTLPSAILTQGAALGLVLAGLMIPQVSRHWGWRANFLVLAAIGVAWSVLWLILGREGPLDDHKSATCNDMAAARVPYGKLLTDPSVLSLLLVGIAGMWSIGLNLTWLPAYLEKGLGFPGVTAGRWVSLMVLAPVPFCLASSWLAERLLKGGATSRKARVMPMIVAMAAGGSLLLGMTSPNLSAASKAILLAIATGLPAVALVLAPPVVASIVPASQRGALLAIYAGVANFASAIAPVVMGRLIESHGTASARGYEVGFMPGACLLLAAAIVCLLLLHPGTSGRTFRAGATLTSQ